MVKEKIIIRMAHIRIILTSLSGFPLRKHAVILLFYYPHLSLSVSN